MTNTQTQQEPKSHINRELSCYEPQFTVHINNFNKMEETEINVNRDVWNVNIKKNIYSAWEEVLEKL